MNTKLMTLAAALVLCTAALPAHARVRTPAAPQTPAAQRTPAAQPTPGHETEAPRAKHAQHRWVKRLGLTEAQRTQLRAEIERAAPQLRETRARARELVRAARQDGEITPQERESLRTQLRALRDEARGDLLPGARALVASLTPEQRARLEAKAKAHGKTLDDTRLGDRIAAGLVRKLARAHGHARGHGDARVEHGGVRAR